MVGVEYESGEVEHQHTVSEETFPLNQTSIYEELVPPSTEETMLFSVDE